MHYSFRFLLAVLAVWRITHMIVREDGPWDVMVRLRRVVSQHVSPKLAECSYCVSFWVALPFIWFLQGSAVERIVSWFALSGAAILLDRTGHEPVRIEFQEEQRWDVAAKR